MIKEKKSLIAKFVMITQSIYSLIKKLLFDRIFNCSQHNFKFNHLNMICFMCADLTCILYAFTEAHVTLVTNSSIIYM